MTKRPAFAPPGVSGAGKSSRKDAALRRPPMTPFPADASAVEIPMVALSIQDYEVLTAPREAFVAFLLAPPSGGGSAVRTGARPTGS